MASARLVLVCVALAALAAAPGAAAAPEDAGRLPLGSWRSLLQTPAGPKTLVIVNLDTNNQPVVCINVTQPFKNTTYGASGTQPASDSAASDLAKLICSDFSAAGKQIFQMVQSGEGPAQQAAQAISQAQCPDNNAVPKAVTVASIQAQDTLATLSDVERFFQALVRALSTVGVPACVTLVESDDAGQRVAAEKYFQTT